MGNLLGDVWAMGEPGWDLALKNDPGVKLHLYGKTSPKIGRKMGHLTVIDADPRQVLSRVLKARESLKNNSQQTCKSTSQQA